MSEALLEAEKAATEGEVPIGAVVVRGDEIVGRGHNVTERTQDPTMHAEMAAIRAAAAGLGSQRLDGCELYVTCEPCTMCAGAIILARLDAVFAGTKSPISGAFGSVRDVLAPEGEGRRLHYETGVMKEECAQALRGFFGDLRGKGKG